MTIACVGITVLDRIFRVEKLPAHGGKFVAKDYFEVGGGPAATAAVAISRQGYDVEFIGRTGDDSVAEIMGKEFSAYGVGQQHIKAIDHASSSFSSIMVDDEGERMIINYQDKSLSRDATWMENIDFAKFEAVLCDVRWPEGASHALRKAKENNIPTILDADITPDDITELVELTEHVVFSQPGLQKFTKTDDPIEGLRIAQKSTQGTVYVTVGSDGCFWLERDEVKHCSGFKVDVVDTTGAGDVFHGAFAVAVAEKMPPYEAALYSSAVAALKCTKPGGREGIPDREHVSEFLNSH